MKGFLTIIRLFALSLSVFFAVVYTTQFMDLGSSTAIYYGIALGALLAGILIGSDLFVRRLNLRIFNTLTLGLLFGYFMGFLLVLFFDTLLSFSKASPENTTLFQAVRAFLYLFSLYFGVVITYRSSYEIYASIPFVRFVASNVKKKDLLLDTSVLCDSRIVDLCSSGILNNTLIVPNFIIKELQQLMESSDENIKNRAKKGLETLKKLEQLPELFLRKNDTDFFDISELYSKLIKLARIEDANILSADIHKVQTASIEGVKILNIHMLSNSLKPLAQAGELIKVKVQRYGKEPRQGVGYLEDGTMVVINGGGDYISETIAVRVLSVKHSASGRMIFCNTLEEDATSAEANNSSQEYENISATCSV